MLRLFDIAPRRMAHVRFIFVRRARRAHAHSISSAKAATQPVPRLGVQRMIIVHTINISSTNLEWNRSVPTPELNLCSL